MRTTTSVTLTCDQAGIIPCRGQGDRLEVLLITSRERRRWIIPKGGKEADLTALASAAKEAYEEAGVRGYVEPEPIGVYAHGERPVRYVEVFVMRVEQELEAWPEQAERSRQWMTVEEALALVGEDGLKPLLEKVGREMG